MPHSSTSQHSVASQDESLSALLDSEASELELRRLLKASEEDSELRDRWGRYQLIGDALRDDLPAVNYTDLSGSIAAAIADEPAPVVKLGGIKSVGGKVTQLWSSLGRVAVAASVAGAVILGVQHYQSPLETGAAHIAESSPSGLPAGYGAPALSARTVSAANHMPIAQERQVSFVPRQVASDQGANKGKEYNAELQAYLNHLMLEHAEHAALNGSRGMLPFARVAELDTKDRFSNKPAASVSAEK